MAHLIFLAGDRTGQKIEIDRDLTTIGRSSDNAISLNDSAVSGQHCVILRQGAAYTLRDLGSTNGTRVNGAATQETRLASGDTIHLGAIDLQISGDDIEPPAATTPQPGSAAPEPQPPVPPPAAPARPGSPTAAFRPSFVARRDSRKAWLVMIGIGVFLVLAAAVWFYLNLRTLGEPEY